MGRRGQAGLLAYPRQCHGDARRSQGQCEHRRLLCRPAGPQRPGGRLAGQEPPFGPGIASIENGICADFARDKEGSEATGFYRVGTTDLNRLVANWLIKEAPKGPGVRGDCGGSLVP